MPPAELTDDDPRIVGSYEILGRLGTGGMSDVYLGRSPGNRLVAIKVIYPHLSRAPQFRQRFAREIESMRAVGGFYTAAIVDADWSGSLIWLATEYIQAPTLRELVIQRGPLDIGEAERLIRGIAEALGAIHNAGVVHGDIEPSNILSTADGPRVIDFGIAQAAMASPEATTVTDTVLGTPGFMSPEQAACDPLGPASDIFSLGATMVFTLIGRGPYGDGTPASLLHRVAYESPDLSPVPAGRLRDAISACLQHDPARRPSAGELLAMFGDVTIDYRQPTPYPVLPQALPTAAHSLPQRHRLVAVAIVAAVLLAAMLGGIGAYIGLHDIGRPGGATPSTPPGLAGQANITLPPASRVDIDLSPMHLELTAGARQLFVSGGNGMSFIDTGTRKVTRSLPFIRGVDARARVSPDGNRVYEWHSADTDVAVRDATGRQVGRLPVAKASDVAVAPDGRRVYVLGYGGQPDHDAGLSGDTVSIVDAATYAIVGAPIRLPFPSYSSLQVSRDGSRLYAVGGGEMLTIDPAAGVITGQVHDRSMSTGMALAESPDGRRAYVSDGSRQSVLAIDLDTQTVTGTTSIGSDVDGVAVSADGQHIYATGVDTAIVYVIDPVRNTVVDKIGVDRAPTAIVAAPDGHGLFVAISKGPIVTVLPLG